MKKYMLLMIFSIIFTGCINYDTISLAKKIAPYSLEELDVAYNKSLLK